MSNPKLLAIDFSLPTFGWSAGENTSYPLSRLKNGYSDIKSRSNGTGAGQTLTAGYGTTFAPNMCIIDGQNFASLGVTSVKLQYDDGAWQDSVTFDIVSNAVQQKDVTGNSANWRVLFSKGSALTLAPEIGNFYLGTKVEFEFTQNWGYYTNVPDYTDNTVNSRALDGRGRSSTTAGPVRKHKISFDQGNAQSDSLITSFLTFLDTAQMNPFYYVDHNGAIYLVKWSRGFNPYEAFRYDQNRIPDLLMESVLAG